MINPESGVVVASLAAYIGSLSLLVVLLLLLLLLLLDCILDLIVFSRYNLFLLMF